jgi:hypothetical protein
MFLASSHPATVLFDSGALHSFISSSFIVKHQLPITIMKQRGVDFLANLIVLDSRGIDIILGMDWLRKYDRVILCAKRAIRLAKEDGTIVEFSVAIQAEQVSLANKVQGTPLNEIRIAREYPDVFPKDLPGMPLDRDIEFVIELLPGTPLSLRGHIGCL